MSQHVALFVAGLLLLAAGAGCLVVGAARLDRWRGTSPFAVGLVAVAFGPCVAGLALDLAAVLRPAPYSMPRLALGTIVGSNVANVGLVLGLSALVRPVAVTARLFSTAVPLLFVATLLFWFLAADKLVSRVDAGVLLAAFAGAVVLLVRAARQEPEAGKAEFAAWVPERMPAWLAAVLAAIGLAGVIGGALLASSEAIGAARALRATGPVLGVLAAAVGTSLPTLVAALLASRRGRSDLVLGLVVSGSLFNLLLVTGAVAMARPLVVEEGVTLNDIPAMALFTFLLLPALLNAGRVPRWEGAVLLAAYAGFVTWQVTGARWW
jgi:cation:H+ antiporter